MTSHRAATSACADAFDVAVINAAMASGQWHELRVAEPSTERDMPSQPIPQ